MTKIMDAYFSEEAADRSGYVVYQSATENKNVDVTFVTAIGKKPVSGWSDLKYVGRVSKFVRSYNHSTYIMAEDRYTFVWELNYAEIQ